MNSPTRIKTSVISPLGIFTERSASCIVTLVGRRLPNPSCWYTEKGRRLILAPKSSNALLIVVYPMIQEMVGLPGSLYFTGIGPVSNSLMFKGRKTFFRTFSFLFFVHISFRNLAYDGTCCIASRRGTLIWTLLNISLIFSIWAFSFWLDSLFGNGTTDLYGCSSVFSLD